MNLTAEQIESIRQRVMQGEINIATLLDDLIDHLCCLVEQKMDEGIDFENSLKEALTELAPNGLKEIQDETLMLLNLKIINMKRITYTIGSLSAMAISFGWFLRFFRMGELGNAFFAIGCLSFFAIFLPMLGYTYFRDQSKSTWAAKLRLIFGVISAVMFGMGFLAKIMHLPGADEVIGAALMIFTFGFLPFLFFTLYKKSISV